MKVGILNNLYNHVFPIPKQLFSKYSLLFTIRHFGKTCLYYRAKRYGGPCTVLKAFSGYFQVLKQDLYGNVFVLHSSAYARDDWERPSLEISRKSTSYIFVLFRWCYRPIPFVEWLTILVNHFYVMREKGKRVRVLIKGRKGGGRIQIQTESVYNETALTENLTLRHSDLAKSKITLDQISPKTDQPNILKIGKNLIRYNINDFAKFLVKK